VIVENTGFNNNRGGRAPGGILMRFIRARRGAVAVEFALGLPIFLFMVYGIFEFGRVFWTQNTMEFAVEEAARYTMVNPNASNSAIIQIVQDKAVGLDVTRIAVTISFEVIGNDRSAVSIVGTYNYAPMIPIVIPFSGGASADFTKLEMDIVTSTRMLLILP
jgi:Flp pilus assembly protein TadG